MFKDFVESEKPSIKILPLFHNSDVFGLRSILLEKKISVQKCTVFEGEDLLYSYYGRPAYKLNSKNATKNIAFFPICLILETEFISFKPKKVFPMDSGAFVKNEALRDEFFHKKMKIDDFELSQEVHSGKKVVSKFYRNNSNYIDQNPILSNDDIPSIELEALCYNSMINSSSNTKFDDRVSTIEYIYDQSIHLNQKNVSGIVLPGAFYADDQIKKIIVDELKIKGIRIYNLVRGNPIEYHALVYSKALDIIKKRLV